MINVTQARTLLIAPAHVQRDLVSRPAQLPTAVDLKRQLTRDLVPVSRAAFDLKSYPGEIVALDEGAKGARYFADKDLFFKLQRAHAEILREDLQAEGWAWVEIREGYHLSLYDFEPERSQDKATAGAIVHYSPYDGKIAVETGLRRKDKGAEDQRRALEEMEDATRADAVAEFRSRLAAALIRDDGALVKLWLLNELIGSMYWDKEVFITGRGGLPDPLFADAAGDYAFPLDLGSVTERNAWGTRKFRETCNRDTNLTGHDQLLAWAALDAHPAPLDLMEYTLASRLSISPQGTLHPVLLALARRYRVAVPTFLLPNQTDIEDAVIAAAAAQTGEAAHVS